MSDLRDEPPPLVNCEDCTHYREFRPGGEFSARVGEPRCQMKYELTFYAPRDYCDEWGYLARCHDFANKAADEAEPHP